MSTQTPAIEAGMIDIFESQRPSFGRLVKVELRKMLDTRGGLWLLLSTLILLVLVVGVVLLVSALDDNAGSPALMDWVQILILPLSLLLPVFPILSVTSEWTQRTGLVTFALEPRRGRTVLAKFGAVIVLALGTVVLAGVLAVIANPVAASLAGDSALWEIDGQVLGFTLLVQLVYFLMAFALGTLLLSSIAAISIFYVMGLLVPLMVYGILYASFQWARDIIPWIDIQFASAPFVSGDDYGGKDIARWVVATGLWVALPLTVGVRRIFRTEIK